MAKKLRVDAQPVFRKKGNEKQFKFNCRVEDRVKEAQSALEKTPPAVDKATTALKEGEKLIAERQKLIRIADRSDHGWATVEEYMEDELADNSDDEKRLFKAEQRAARKIKGNSNTKLGKRRATVPSSFAGSLCCLAPPIASICGFDACASKMRVLLS